MCKLAQIPGNLKNGFKGKLVRIYILILINAKRNTCVGNCNTNIFSKAAKIKNS
jgi:hypothetical protein